MAIELPLKNLQLAGYADDEDRRHHQREVEQESANNCGKNRAGMSSPGSHSRRIGLKCSRWKKLIACIVEESQLPLRLRGRKLFEGQIAYSNLSLAVLLICAF